MVAVEARGELSERDRDVIALVARFGQMSRSQLSDCLFAELASQTPLDRTLKRLTDATYLARVERRLVGGSRSGSGQYVYQLGRAGWKLLDKPGAYWAPRTVNLHTLMVAACYTTFRRAERADDLEVIQFTTEPDCHHTVGTIRLTPDAYVEIGSRADRLKYAYWLEVDRGSEHRNTIEEKCDRYQRAFQWWQDDYFPTVLFVVPDEQRKAAISTVIKTAPPLFAVCLLDQVPLIAKASVQAEMVKESPIS